MWTQDELTDLSFTVRKVDIGEFCTDEEIAVIGENSTRLRNLKSDIFVPKHKRSVSLLIVFLFWLLFQTKTIYLKQMWHDVDLMEWLKAVGKCLRFQDMMIWLSFSCILEKGHMSERSLIYKYATKEVPLARLKLDSEVIFLYKLWCLSFFRTNGTAGSMNSKG